MLGNCSKAEKLVIDGLLATCPVSSAPLATYVALLARRINIPEELLVPLDPAVAALKDDNEALVEALEAIPRWNLPKANLAAWAPVLDMMDHKLQEILNTQSVPSLESLQKPLKSSANSSASSGSAPEASTDVTASSAVLLENLRLHYLINIPKQVPLTCEIALPSTRRLVLAILRFTRLLIQNSTNRRKYNSMEHIAMLLGTMDSDIHIAALELLHALCKHRRLQLQSPSVISLIRPLTDRLEQLAAAWGGSRQGLSVLNCYRDESEQTIVLGRSIVYNYCMAPAPDDAPSETSSAMDTSDPSGSSAPGMEDVNDATSQPTTEPAHAAGSSPAKVTVQIAIPDVRTYLPEEAAHVDPSRIGTLAPQVLSAILKTYNVPPQYQFGLLVCIRRALVFPFLQQRIEQMNVRLAAFCVIAMTRENKLVTSLLNDDPDLLDELVDALQQSSSLPMYARTLIVRMLTGISTLVNSHRFEGILRELGVAQFHGILPSALRQCAASLAAAEEITRLEEQYALTLLKFFVLSSIPRSGNKSLVASGVVATIMPLLNLRGIRTVNVLTLINALLEMLFKRAESVNDSHFISLGGVTAILDRLKLELDDIMATYGSVPPESRKPLSCELSHYLSSCFTFCRLATRIPTLVDHMRSAFDGSLPQCLRIVIEHRHVFSSSTVADAINLVADFVHHEPTLLSAVQESGLASLVLDAVLRTVPLHVEQLKILPHAVSALSLNSAGLKMVTDIPDAFLDVLSIFTRPIFTSLLSSGMTVAKLGTGFEELIRHQPTLRPVVLQASVTILRRLVLLANPATAAAAVAEYAELPRLDPIDLEELSFCERSSSRGSGDAAPMDVSSSSSSSSSSASTVAAAPSVVYPIGSDRRLQMLYGLTGVEEDEELEAILELHENQGDQFALTGCSAPFEPIREVRPTDTVVPVVDMICNFCRFLETFISAEDACKEFANLGGVDLMVDLLTAPALPADFWRSSSCAFISAVLRQVSQLCDKEMTTIAINRLHRSVVELQSLTGLYHLQGLPVLVGRMNESHADAAVDSALHSASEADATLPARPPPDSSDAFFALKQSDERLVRAFNHLNNLVVLFRTSRDHRRLSASAINQATQQWMTETGSATVRGLCQVFVNVLSHLSTVSTRKHLMRSSLFRALATSELLEELPRLTRQQRQPAAGQSAPRSQATVIDMSLDWYIAGRLTVNSSVGVDMDLAAVDVAIRLRHFLRFLLSLVGAAKQDPARANVGGLLSTVVDGLLEPFSRFADGQVSGQASPMQSVPLLAVMFKEIHSLLLDDRMQLAGSGFLRGLMDNFGRSRVLFVALEAFVQCLHQVARNEAALLLHPSLPAAEARRRLEPSPSAVLGVVCGLQLLEFAFRPESVSLLSEADAPRAEQLIFFLAESIAKLLLNLFGQSETASAVLAMFDPINCSTIWLLAGFVTSQKFRSSIKPAAPAPSADSPDSILRDHVPGALRTALINAYSAANPVTDPALVSMMVDMGFPERHAVRALRAANNDIALATEWALEHDYIPDRDTTAPSSAAAAAAPAPAAEVPAVAAEVPAVAAATSSENDEAALALAIAMSLQAQPDPSASATEAVPMETDTLPASSSAAGDIPPTESATPMDFASDSIASVSTTTNVDTFEPLSFGVNILALTEQLPSLVLNSLAWIRHAEIVILMCNTLLGVTHTLSELLVIPTPHELADKCPRLQTALVNGPLTLRVGQLLIDQLEQTKLAELDSEDPLVHNRLFNQLYLLTLLLHSEPALAPKLTSALARVCIDVLLHISNVKSLPTTPGAETTLPTETAAPHEHLVVRQRLWQAPLLLLLDAMYQIMKVHTRVAQAETELGLSAPSSKPSAASSSSSADVSSTKKPNPAPASSSSASSSSTRPRNSPFSIFSPSTFPMHSLKNEVQGQKERSTAALLEPFGGTAPFSFAFCFALPQLFAQTDVDDMLLACSRLLDSERSISGLTPPTVSQAACQLLVLLTQDHRNAIFLFEHARVLSLLFALPKPSRFQGIDLLITMLIRHVFEDQHTLAFSLKQNLIVRSHEFFTNRSSRSGVWAGSSLFYKLVGAAMRSEEATIEALCDLLRLPTKPSEAKHVSLARLTVLQTDSGSDSAAASDKPSSSASEEPTTVSSRYPPRFANETVVQGVVGWLLERLVVEALANPLLQLNLPPAVAEETFHGVATPATPATPAQPSTARHVSPGTAVPAVPAVVPASLAPASLASQAPAGAAPPKGAAASQEHELSVPFILQLLGELVVAFPACLRMFINYRVAGFAPRGKRVSLVQFILQYLVPHHAVSTAESAPAVAANRFVCEIAMRSCYLIASLVAAARNLPPSPEAIVQGSARPSPPVPGDEIVARIFLRLRSTIVAATVQPLDRRARSLPFLTFLLADLMSNLPSAPSFSFEWRPPTTQEWRDRVAGIAVRLHAVPTLALALKALSPSTMPQGAVDGLLITLQSATRQAALKLLDDKLFAERVPLTPAPTAQTASTSLSRSSRDAAVSSANPPPATATAPLDAGLVQLSDALAMPPPPRPLAGRRSGAASPRTSARPVSTGTVPMDVAATSVQQQPATQQAQQPATQQAQQPTSAVPPAQSAAHSSSLDSALSSAAGTPAIAAHLSSEPPLPMASMGDLETPRLARHGFPHTDMNAPATPMDQRQDGNLAISPEGDTRDQPDQPPSLLHTVSNRSSREARTRAAARRLLAERQLVVEGEEDDEEDQDMEGHDFSLRNLEDTFLNLQNNGGGHFVLQVGGEDDDEGQLEQDNAELLQDAGRHFVLQVGNGGVDNVEAADLAQRIRNAVDLDADIDPELDDDILHIPMGDDDEDEDEDDEEDNELDEEEEHRNLAAADSEADDDDDDSDEDEDAESGSDREGDSAPLRGRQLFDAELASESESESGEEDEDLEDDDQYEDVSGSDNDDDDDDNDENGGDEDDQGDDDDEAAAGLHASRGPALARLLRSINAGESSSSRRARAPRHRARHTGTARAHEGPESASRDSSAAMENGFDALSERGPDAEAAAALSERAPATRSSRRSAAAAAAAAAPQRTSRASSRGRGGAAPAHHVARHPTSADSSSSAPSMADELASRASGDAMAESDDDDEWEDDDDDDEPSLQIHNPVHHDDGHGHHHHDHDDDDDDDDDDEDDDDDGDGDDEENADSSGDDSGARSPSEMFAQDSAGHLAEENMNGNDDEDDQDDAEHGDGEIFLDTNQGVGLAMSRHELIENVRNELVRHSQHPAGDDQQLIQPLVSLIQALARAHQSGISAEDIEAETEMHGASMPLSAPHATHFPENHNMRAMEASLIDGHSSAPPTSAGPPSGPSPFGGHNPTFVGIQPWELRSSIRSPRNGEAGHPLLRSELLSIAPGETLLAEKTVSAKQQKGKGKASETSLREDAAAPSAPSGSDKASVVEPPLRAKTSRQSTRNFIELPLDQLAESVQNESHRHRLFQRVIVTTHTGMFAFAALQLETLSPPSGEAPKNNTAASDNPLHESSYGLRGAFSSLAMWNLEFVMLQRHASYDDLMSIMIARLQRALFKLPVVTPSQVQAKTAALVSSRALPRGHLGRGVRDRRDYDRSTTPTYPNPDMVGENAVVAAASSSSSAPGPSTSSASTSLSQFERDMGFSLPDSEGLSEAHGVSSAATGGAASAGAASAGAASAGAASAGAASAGAVGAPAATGRPAPVARAASHAEAGAVSPSHSAASDNRGIDPAFLAALPPAQREQVLAQERSVAPYFMARAPSGSLQVASPRLSERPLAAPSGSSAAEMPGIDPTFLAALAPAARERVLEQERIMASPARSAAGRATISSPAPIAPTLAASATAAASTTAAPSAAPASSTTPATRDAVVPTTTAEANNVAHAPPTRRAASSHDAKCWSFTTHCDHHTGTALRHFLDAETLIVIIQKLVQGSQLSENGNAQLDAILANLITNVTARFWLFSALLCVLREACASAELPSAHSAAASSVLDASMDSGMAIAVVKRVLDALLALSDRIVGLCYAHTLDISHAKVFGTAYLEGLPRNVQEFVVERSGGLGEALRACNSPLADELGADKVQPLSFLISLLRCNVVQRSPSTVERLLTLIIQFVPSRHELHHHRKRLLGEHAAELAARESGRAASSSSASTVAQSSVPASSSSAMDTAPAPKSTESVELAASKTPAAATSTTTSSTTTTTVPSSIFPTAADFRATRGTLGEIPVLPTATLQELVRLACSALPWTKMALTVLRRIAYANPWNEQAVMPELDALCQQHSASVIAELATLSRQLHALIADSSESANRTRAQKVQLAFEPFSSRTSSQATFTHIIVTILSIRSREKADAEKERSKQRSAVRRASAAVSDVTGGGGTVALGNRSADSPAASSSRTHLPSAAMNTSSTSSATTTARAGASSSLLGETEPAAAALHKPLYALNTSLGLTPLWEKLSESLGYLAQLDASDSVGILLPLVEIFFMIHRDVEAFAKPSTKGGEGAPAASAATPVVSRNIPAASPLTSTIGPGGPFASGARSPHITAQTAGSPLAPSASLLARGDSVTSTHANLDPDSARFIAFVETHRKIINDLMHRMPWALTRGPFDVLVHLPRVLDFDNKRIFFRHKLTQLEKGKHYAPIRLQVRRERIFEDSLERLSRKSDTEMHGRLTVQFANEEGVDAGGVTREWFLILSRELFNANYALFKSSPEGSATYQPFAKSSVNPNHLALFRFAGRVIAKAIIDNRMLECYFTRSFYKHILGRPVTYHDIEATDPDYFKSLKWILENDITDVIDETFAVEVEDFGDKKMVDLKPNGQSIPVTEENKAEYVQLVTENRLTSSIRSQIDAFLTGFYGLLPKELIAIFNEQELELLISGLPEIDVEDLKANTDYTRGGYTDTAPQIQWLWRALRSFDHEEKAKFLQFVTGTSKVPLDGFKALEGMNGRQRFSVHKAFGDAYRLPSAHTCFNQLDLPEYESYEVLKERLLTAVTECSTGFGFA
ncbi:Huwe1 protein [Capsaspora owczarzaki ATCC 30864]|uniref:HECT-type E3 ubiquitin transferase n=1 Tax=Capsaspora owczarzaki (strain ATCC 30864) TaxID=595528 RepID=A0A0D2VPV4_CAPO3|nr:Huwe1 protein [Capsaspora owczarzaki ATCC 30864]KJE92552.1 Huwe1 protein [Capsaspora owczarzaki ATCC 30864]|eukprot:XP_004348403.2 Huwe1 protein [Capsaspora owczarzaki ATCC 30864]